MSEEVEDVMEKGKDQCKKSMKDSLQIVKTFTIRQRYVSAINLQHKNYYKQHWTDHYQSCFENENYRPHPCPLFPVLHGAPVSLTSVKLNFI